MAPSEGGHLVADLRKGSRFFVPLFKGSSYSDTTKRVRVNKQIRISPSES